jgi:hypothetical protein
MAKVDAEDVPADKPASPEGGEGTAQPEASKSEATDDTPPTDEMPPTDGETSA